MKSRGTNGAAQKVGPWEPDEQQLAIYAEAIRGTPYTKIGERHGCTRSNVCKLVKKINEWLWPQRMEQVREIKAEHTESLMVIFREAMAAWERSKRPEGTIRVKHGGQHGKERSRTLKGQAGNPAFLQEARAALAEIRRIWGADAPITHQHTGEVRVAGVSREQAIQDQIQRMQAALVPKEN